MVHFKIRAKDSLTWSQLRGAVEWSLAQYPSLLLEFGDLGVNIVGDLFVIDRLQLQLRQLFKGFPLVFKVIATL